MAEVASAETRTPRRFVEKLKAAAARLGSRAEPAAEAVEPGPTDYRTFSPKLAPGLVGAGGILILLGGLGAWIRASQVVTEGLNEEEVRVVMGYTSDWGRVLGVLGALTTIGAIAWVVRGVWPKLASIVVTAAAVGIAVWRLPLIDQAAARIAADARTGTIDFISFHVGFGWGSWCLVAGAVTVTLGCVAGVLRQLDLRKGVPA